MNSQQSDVVEDQEEERLSSPSGTFELRPELKDGICDCCLKEFKQVQWWQDAAWSITKQCYEEMEESRKQSDNAVEKNKTLTAVGYFRVHLASVPRGYIDIPVYSKEQWNALCHDESTDINCWDGNLYANAHGMGTCMRMLKS